MFGVGFDLFSTLFPIFFTIIFVFVIGTMIAMLVRGAKEKRKNDASPRLSVPATVVTKRTNVSHRHHNGANDMDYCTTDTTYYVTFQVESGDPDGAAHDRARLWHALRGRPRDAAFPGHALPRLRPELTFFAPPFFPFSSLRKERNGGAKKGQTNARPYKIGSKRNRGPSGWKGRCILLVREDDRQEAHGLVGVILDGVCVAIGAEFRVADAEDARLAVFGHGCAAFEDEIGFAIAGVRMDTDGLAGFQRDDGHELRTVPQLLSREQIAGTSGCLRRPARCALQQFPSFHRL